MKQIAIDYDGKLIPFSGDAYVNLTAMCAAFGKSPHHFLQLEATAAFVAALAADTGLPRDGVSAGLPRSLSPKVMSENPSSLLVTVRGNHADGREQGTWAHPDLAIKCAAWCYPPFEVWMMRTIRKLLSGELIHPAMDKENIKEREARIAGLKNRAHVELDRYWKVQEVEGNVTTKAYFRAIGLELTRTELSAISASLRHRSEAYGYPMGKVRQRRSRGYKKKEDRGGWQTVSTYPPAEIHAELVRREWLPAGAPLADPAAVAEQTEKLTARVFGSMPETSAVETPAAHLNAPRLATRSSTTLTMNCQSELAF